MNKLTHELCSRENLKFDGSINCYTGYRSGYPLMLSAFGKNYELILSVSNGNFPDPEVMKQLVGNCMAIRSCKVSGYRVRYAIKRGVGTKALLHNIAFAIDSAVRFLSAYGYFACCEESGERENVSVYTVAGVPRILSERSFSAASQKVSAREFELSKKSENVIAGAAGALIGSVLGAGAIILIARLGYVSVLGGLIMGILSIRGYELLAGKFSVKGISISVIIMIGMVYLSNRLDWTITIMREAGADFSEAFTHVHDVIKIAELEMTYYVNLSLLYLFTLIGAIPMLISAFKSHKVRKNAYKL